MRVFLGMPCRRFTQLTYLTITHSFFFYHLMTLTDSRCRASKPGSTAPLTKLGEAEGYMPLIPHAPLPSFPHIGSLFCFLYILLIFLLLPLLLDSRDNE